MLGICKTCNKEFKYSPSQQSGSFCSRDCNQDYKNKTIMESGKASKISARTYLKRFVEYKCSCCGISEWNGKEIALQIEHIDGNPNNNVVENITWLCPNCHTQTDTWGVQNASREGRLRMVTNIS